MNQYTTLLHSHPQECNIYIQTYIYNTYIYIIHIYIYIYAQYTCIYIYLLLLWFMFVALYIFSKNSKSRTSPMHLLLTPGFVSKSPGKFPQYSCWAPQHALPEAGSQGKKGRRAVMLWCSWRYFKLNFPGVSETKSSHNKIPISKSMQHINIMLGPC